MAAIDERTLLVPISHVIFRIGRIQDVEPIIERAHEVGAHVVLDAYQSVGTVPLDVTALNVDFAVGGSVKWLCGGPGAGWLYVRPDLAGDARADARRLAGARPAVRLRARARVRGGGRPLPDRDAERARRSTRRRRATTSSRRSASIAIRAQLGAADDPADRPARRGGFRGRQPARDRAARRLGRRPHARLRGCRTRSSMAREIICDFRPDVGLRFGPHFFTTDEEIELAVSALKEIVGRGATLPRPGRIRLAPSPSRSGLPRPRA